MLLKRLICTEQIFQELKLPKFLKSLGDGSDLIGQEIICDAATNAALILEPPDPREGRWNFHVCIDGNCFNMLLSSNKATIHIGNKPNEINELYLKNFAQHAAWQMLPYLKEDQCEFSIVKIRKESYLRPFISRPPKTIFAVLNAATAIYEGDNESYLPQFAIPILLMCVRKEELEEFIAYGKQTSWDGLSKPALKVVTLCLEKSDNEIRHIFIR